MSTARAQRPDLSQHSIGTALRTIAHKVLERVFPWTCVGCEGAAKFALCDRCLAAIRWIKDPICPRCGLRWQVRRATCVDVVWLGPRHSSGFGRLLLRPSEERDPLGVALRALKYGRRRG